MTGPCRRYRYRERGSSKASIGQRIELIGPTCSNHGELKRHGVIIERIDWASRLFIPTERGAGEHAIEEIIQTRPVISSEVPITAKKSSNDFAHYLEDDALLAEKSSRSGLGIDAVPAIIDAQQLLGDFLVRSGLLGKVRLWPVETFAALPDEVRHAAQKAGGTKDDTCAVYHKDGSIWFVRDAHSIREDLERSIFHEGYGHLGIFELFGDEATGQLNALYGRLGGYKGMAAIADRYGVRDDFDSYWQDAQDDATAEAGRARATLALRGQKSPALIQKAKEVWGALRNWFRRVGLVELSR